MSHKVPDENALAQRRARHHLPDVFLAALQNEVAIQLAHEDEGVSLGDTEVAGGATVDKVGEVRVVAQDEVTTHPAGVVLVREVDPVMDVEQVRVVFAGDVREVFATKIALVTRLYDAWPDGIRRVNGENGVVNRERRRRLERCLTVHRGLLEW